MEPLLASLHIRIFYCSALRTVRENVVPAATLDAAMFSVALREIRCLS